MHIIILRKTNISTIDELGISIGKLTKITTFTLDF